MEISLTPAMMTYLVLAGHPNLRPVTKSQRKKFVLNVRSQAQREYGWMWKQALKKFVDRLPEGELRNTFN